jgi:hypothetical protein
MSDHDRNLCNTCLQQEYESFRHACVHESIAQNKVLFEERRIDTWPRWDYSMEDATLIFSEDGNAKVICQIEVAGSTTPKSWEWSWGNENFPISCRKRMGAVYALGEEKQWDKLTSLFLEYDEFIGWECASIANHVLNGIGIYRCPNSEGHEEDAVYVVILSAEFVN